MQAGKLRRRITIEEKVSAPDGGGGNSVQWQAVATVWADIQPAGGSEVFTQGQVRSDVTHNIEIRYRTGLKPSMRVNYGGRLFNIRSIIDKEERHRRLVLKCEELQAGTA